MNDFIREETKYNDVKYRELYNYLGTVVSKINKIKEKEVVDAIEDEELML